LLLHRVAKNNEIDFAYVERQQTNRGDDRRRPREGCMLDLSYRWNASL